MMITEDSVLGTGPPFDSVLRIWTRIHFCSKEKNKKMLDLF